MRRICHLAAVLIAATALTGPSQVSSANQSPLEVVQMYLDHVASGNYESAIELWTSSANDRANRFGITYSGIPVRVDAASPMVSHAQQLAGYTVQPVQSLQNVGDDARYIKMLFTATGQGTVLQQWYYTKHEGEWYWLCYPQDAIANAWPVQESRYFRVHVHPAVANYVSSPALAQFDEFVEVISDSLGLTKADIALIASKKIEYFYCNDDSSVLAITGQFTKGVMDLSSNDIISSSFPHHHEVVHLLANIKLKELPLYTLPALREGLAVKFGGRWGKGPAALLDLGAFLHRDTLVIIDSLLTVAGFENSSEMDLMYPVSGVLVSYLWDRLGKQKFWTLYRGLSAPQDSINRLTSSNIEKALTEATAKKSWGDIKSDFDAYLNQRGSSWAATAAGTSGKGKVLWSERGNTVLLDGDWLSFTVKADSGVLPRESFLFFKDTTYGSHISLLFNEHFMGAVPFEGYRYGVRIDQNEAGVYDYAGNILTGKFILGISGSDHYYDTLSNTVTVRFRKSLFGRVPPGPESITAVPY